MRVAHRPLPSWKEEEALPILNNILRGLVYAINSIQFGTVEDGAENVWCSFVVVDSGSANEVCSASHSLNRAPVGTICIWQDKAGVWYKPTDPTSADTTTAFFYICNTAATSAVLLVF